jgi:hypothetical protein
MRGFQSPLLFRFETANRVQADGFVEILQRALKITCGFERIAPVVECPGIVMLVSIRLLP